MKQILVILSTLALICSCASQQSQKPNEAPISATKISPIQPPKLPPPEKQKDIKPLFGNLLSDVTTSRSSFNPTQDESVELIYNLAKPAKVTVNIYDPDSGLIYSFSDEFKKEPGQNTFTWNGKDMDGNIVADEAYFFTILAEDEAGKEEIYDPTTFSGGIEHDITVADIDPQHFTINYHMPEMGRVMIRLGIQGGALMNQLVDWKPRVKGAITEHWNGKDKDNLVTIFDHSKFKMIIAYFTLPDNSVITYGNRDTQYLEYKKTFAANRPTKPQRATSVTQRSHHYGIPRTKDYTPEVNIAFSNVQGESENGLPILNEKTIVNVTLGEDDKPIFQNSQFEICFFLNHEFYAEDETGYTPFNWVWDLNQVEAGEYLLTVNVTSFDDQVGVLSRKVKVVK